MIAITRMSNSILSKGNYFILLATNDRELNCYHQQKTLTSLFFGSAIISKIASQGWETYSKETIAPNITSKRGLCTPELTWIKLSIDIGVVLSALISTCSIKASRKSFKVKHILHPKALQLLFHNICIQIQKHLT